MVNKNIQEKRMKEYFVEAGYAILLEEGNESLSVRNIAKKAGYSYATIYNYFSNSEELMWAIGYRVLEKLTEIIKDKFVQYKDDINCRELLNLVYREYINYFLENESAYQFIFLKSIDSSNINNEEKNKIPVLFNLQQEIMQNCVDAGFISQENKFVCGELLTNSINGLLALYFSGKEELKKEDIYTKLENYVNYLIFT